MNKIIFALILSATLSLSQQRYLLHINREGTQEAIPIRPNEKTSDAIERLEKQTSEKISFLLDTLRYFANDESDLRANFGFMSNDYAFQWFVPQADGEVKEFWWRNNQLRGKLKKAAIRAWIGNPRLLELPTNAVNEKGFMGAYYTGCDCCWDITPIKTSSAGNFNPINVTDTAHVFFDPLQEEAKWLPSGIEVTLDSNKWQGIKLKEWGEPFYFETGQVFGFTLHNINQCLDGNDIRMELLSKEIAAPDSTVHFSPYHSIKFYTFRTIDNSWGWKIRNYDWGIYVVVDYTTDGPWLTFQFLNIGQTTDNNSPRKISAIVKNLGGPAMPTKIKDVYLKYKIGYPPYFESVKMTANADTFSAMVPGLPSGKKMSLYIAAFDSFGRRFQSQVQSYSNITSVPSNEQLPTQSALSQNYPNPFNPTTHLRFTIADVQFVSLKIYDALGREIAALVSQPMNAGTYTVRWDATSHPSGVYFYRLSAGGFVETKKLMILK